MILNYLKTTIRAYRHQRLFIFINLSGLVTGLVTTLFILVYVQHELSYDTFNENVDQTFRVYEKFKMEGREGAGVLTPGPLAEFLKSNMANIRNTVRVLNVNKILFSTEDQNLYEDGLILADPTILDVFTFPLEAGDPQSVLVDPNSIVITRSMAKKYF